jgi:ribosomal protein S17E
MADDFIENFTDFITDEIDTNKDWAESISTCLLGTAIGPMITTITRVGYLHLNTWYMVIGTSGLAHKTTPLKYFAIPMVNKLSDELQKSLLMPSRFSIEGMIQYFNKIGNEGIVIRDEFTSAFKETNKEYLTDMTEFLSECYDGSVQKRYTRSTDLQESKSVYVNFMAATTPYLFRVMQYDFFIQGTGNRIMFIVDTRDGRSIRREEFENYFVNPTSLIERDNRFLQYAKDLLALRSSSVRYVMPMRDAGNALLEFKYKIDTDLVKRYNTNIYDIYAPYMARMSEMTYKLTALHAISRSYLNLAKAKTIDYHQASIEDALWAIDKVQRHFNHFCKMIEVWRQRPEVMVVRTLDEQIGQLSEYLQTRERGESWSVLRAKMRWNDWAWSNILHQVFDTKQVIFLERKQEGPGRPSIILVHPSCYDKAKTDGDKVIEDWNLLRIKTGLR